MASMRLRSRARATISPTAGARSRQHWQKNLALECWWLVGQSGALACTRRRSRWHWAQSVSTTWIETRTASRSQGRWARNPIEGSYLLAANSASHPIVVDATNDARGLKFALRATAAGGVCTTVGIFPRKTTGIPMLRMYSRGLTLKTGVSNARPAIPAILELVRQWPIAARAHHHHAGGLGGSAGCIHVQLDQSRSDTRDDVPDG